MPNPREENTTDERGANGERGGRPYFGRSNGRQKPTKGSGIELNIMNIIQVCNTVSTLGMWVPECLFKYLLTFRPKLHSTSSSQDKKQRKKKVVKSANPVTSSPEKVLCTMLTHIHTHNNNTHINFSLSLYVDLAT